MIRCPLFVPEWTSLHSYSSREFCVSKRKETVIITKEQVNKISGSVFPSVTRASASWLGAGEEPLQERGSSLAWLQRYQAQNQFLRLLWKRFSAGRILMIRCREGSCFLRHRLIQQHGNGAPDGSLCCPRLKASLLSVFITPSLPFLNQPTLRCF